MVGQAAPYMGMGLALTASILLPLWIGYRLDRRYGTEPLWILAGAVLGLLCAFYQFFKVYRTFTDKKR